MILESPAGIRPCPRCRAPELDGYPHRHFEPVRADYDPMPDKPAETYCGPIDVSAYWTDGEWSPACCLVHVAIAEYRAEIPERIHPSYGRVPTRTEAIGTARFDEASASWVPDPDGPRLEVLDVGRLGGYPFAPPAARRFGGVTMLSGEATLDARDYRSFPWAYAIERRLAGYCRRRHATRPDRYPEHAGGPLCPSLVRLVVVDGFSPAAAAERLELPTERVAILLEDALRWVWRRVSEELNEIALGAKNRTQIVREKD